MKFGIQHPSFSFDGREIIDTLSAIAKTAEEYEYDSLWMMDHLHQIEYVGKPEEPMLEGWTTISVLAGMTMKLKLGTMVTGNIYRYPAVLAKIGATLDVLSKGRLIFGFGAGWNESESRAYGVPFPSTRERLERLDEAVQIVEKMWVQETTTFDGRYYKIENAYCNPKPVQKPRPMVLIGGSGEKYLLRTVAKYGDACNLFGSPETVKKKLDVLCAHCQTVGRDYDSILKTKLTRVLISEDEAAVKRVIDRMPQGFPLRETMIYGTPDEVKEQVEEFRAVGVEYMVVSASGPGENESLRLFGEKVMPNFNK